MYVGFFSIYPAFSSSNTQVTVFIFRIFFVFGFCPAREWGVTIKIPMLSFPISLVKYRNLLIGNWQRRVSLEIMVGKTCHDKTYNRRSLRRMFVLFSCCSHQEQRCAYLFLCDVSQNSGKWQWIHLVPPQIMFIFFLQFGRQSILGLTEFAVSLCFGVYLQIYSLVSICIYKAIALKKITMA